MRRNGQPDGVIGGTARPADGLGGTASRMGGDGTSRPLKAGPLLCVRAVRYVRIPGSKGIAPRTVTDVVAIEALGHLDAAAQVARVEERKAEWERDHPDAVVEWE